MSDKKVINRKTFKQNEKCCTCGQTFTGRGYSEKYILGQTREGYVYAFRSYCETCGEKRLDTLVSRHQERVPQYYEEEPLDEDE